MLIAAILCQTAPAQQANPPQFLFGLQPDSQTTGYRCDACNLLDGQHIQSVAMRFNTGARAPYELRYTIPPGYNRFTALAGVDNKFSDPNLEFSFTVIGIDAQGVRKPQPLKTAHSMGKPQAIDVDLTGYKQLVLAVGCVNNQGRFVDCKYLEPEHANHGAQSVCP